MDKDRFYYDKKFLGGMGGRPLRILSEYLGPLNSLQKNNIRDTIVFFGSARLMDGNEYYQTFPYTKVSENSSYSW